MQTLLRRQSHKAGLPPGSLVPVGASVEGPVRVSVIDYTESEYLEKEIESAEECLAFKDKDSVTWINVDGLHDLELVKKIGEYFDIHRLTLEDILNTDHRPKTEDFSSYIFITLKMLYLSDDKEQIMVEQVNFVLGPKYVISFQEKAGDVFQVVRKRLQQKSGLLRRRGAAYLAYTLIDALVDRYYIILESLADDIEELEEYMIADGRELDSNSIYALKREVTLLRRSVWPLRDAVSSLEKAYSDLIDPPTQIYLRDLHDHTVTIIDTLDTFQEMAGNILAVHMNMVSNKMNEVMKLLTVIATIFIPLTFVVGVYGMNFINIPELKWRYGYFAVWGIMVLAAVVMALAFRKKKWL